MKGGVALVSIGTSAQSLLKGSIAFAAQNGAYVADPNNKKILILVQCAGGNDGLNTLVPYADATYRICRAWVSRANGIRHKDTKMHATSRLKPA